VAYAAAALPIADRLVQFSGSEFLSEADMNEHSSEARPSGPL